MWSGQLGLQFLKLFFLIGNFTVCGFYFILFILHALRRADDAYIVGEIYNPQDLSFWFFDEKGFLSIDSVTRKPVD